MSFISEPTFWQDGAQEIALYGYQDESLRIVGDNFRLPDVTAQILSIPTGGGKTTMGAFLLKQHWEDGKRGMFVVDRISLLGQTSETFDLYGIPHGVIQSGHPRCHPGERIQIASIHTLARRGWPAPLDLIISDEQHVCYKTMLTKIARKDTKVLGLTATPFTRGLGKHFQKLVNVTTTNKLIDEGVLCPFKVWAAKEPDMQGVKTDKFGEWEEKETSKRAVRIVGDVVKEYQDKGEGGKAIAFGVDVAHCEEMQRQFLSAGISAALYTYLTGPDERDYLIGKNGEFRKPNSSVRVLISVAALSRGFDVPDVSVIIMCRPLRNSFMEFIQVMGRGLRAYPGKHFVRILDLAGNFLRHHAAMLDFFEEGATELDDGKPKPKTASAKAERKPVKCPKCFYLPVVGACCPACGHMLPPKKAASHLEGILQEFDFGSAKRWTKAEKVTLYGELQFIAKKNGYRIDWVRRKWVARKYRLITGVSPQGVRGCDIAPSAATLALVAALTVKPKEKPVAGILAQSQAVLAADLFG